MADQRELVTGLAGRLGLAGLEPDEAGLYSLFIDGGLPVFMQFTTDGAGVVLFAGLGTIEAGNAGAACRALLEANHFWTETGGFTLCLIPGTLNLMLVGRERVQHLEGDGLFLLFDRFVSAASTWRQRLPGIAEDAPSASVEALLRAAEEAPPPAATATAFPGSFV
jgi:hypothetical protein